MHLPRPARMERDRPAVPRAPPCEQAAGGARPAVTAPGCAAGVVHVGRDPVAAAVRHRLPVVLLLHPADALQDAAGHLADAGEGRGVPVLLLPPRVTFGGAPLGVLEKTQLCLLCATRLQLGHSFAITRRSPGARFSSTWRVWGLSVGALPGFQQAAWCPLTFLLSPIPVCRGCWASRTWGRSSSSPSKTSRATSSSSP